jgi:MinD-like ATPase involved in chromosome partitioning or flagellar assembly
MAEATTPSANIATASKVKETKQLFILFLAISSSNLHLSLRQESKPQLTTKLHKEHNI